MPREIWTEGRVCGLSAYETYVKQHLSEDPTTPPATEREWLASSLAMGSSMLLKVPATTNPATIGSEGHYYVDIPLPVDSKLAAANTIVAQFFEGEATFDNENQWAVRITDYGQLISNTSTSSPSGTIAANQMSNVPRQTLSDWSKDKKNKLKNYMKIYDGLILQPGTWTTWSGSTPKKDFQANLSRPYPTVRLHIRGTIASDAEPYVLLTGFTIRTVLAGTVGQDTVLESGSPQDGDFLGPAVFPWAAKIVFCVPSSYITYLSNELYDRTIDTNRVKVKDKAIVDMQRTKPETYYDPSTYAGNAAKHSANTTNPRKQYTVNAMYVADDVGKEAVLTVYQKSTAYPPALYGTYVSSDGTNYLNPLDVVAPGTVKMFYNQANATEMANYENTFPGTTAINKTADGKLQILNSNGVLTDIVSTQYSRFYNQDSGTGFVFADTTFVTNPVTYKPMELDQHNNPLAGQLTDTHRPTLLKVITGTDNGHNHKYALALSDNISVDPVGGSTVGVRMSKTPERDKSIQSNNMSTDTSGNPTGYIKKYTECHQGGQQQIHLITNKVPLYTLDGIEIALKYFKNVAKQGTDDVYPWNHVEPILLQTEWTETDGPKTFNNLNWATLIAALQTNRSIDILGERLKSIKHTSSLPHNSNVQGQESTGPFIEFGPTQTSIISKYSRKTTAETPEAYETPIRLYVTISAPPTTNVPEGSIGIGWGLDTN